MKVTILLLVVNFIVCLCYKKQFVQNRPQPMRNFNPEKAIGRWYYIARYISCKFQGAREFTDQIRTIDLDPSVRFYNARYDYRIGPKCYNLEDVRTINAENSAVKFVKDRIGDLYTGERIVVATDYPNFMIEWGCLEYSQDKPTLCKDVLINVMARTPNPSRRTRFIIDTILRKLFNLVVTDLDIMKHGNLISLRLITVPWNPVISHTSPTATSEPPIT